jgi:propanol-preferring alcohol dehydrogenase
MLICTPKLTDTGEDKKKLALSLGAEKWIDFKQSKDLVKDIKDATEGLGPHATIVTAATVRKPHVR